ncbi:CLUMA_CG004491, isoform A [Clunio marinus]|uniref:CLUMA_CG004491, isoform A n=1 Tax=Clunio marinus TaxID=568069 RepID=A0A1J1HXE1_9DIPT|nr:CLUMA_CG004491, isoform A [Clunio marinus]
MSIPKNQHQSPTQTSLKHLQSTHQQQLTPNSQRILLETSFGAPPLASNANGMNGLNAKSTAPLRRAPKTVAFSNNGASYPPPPKYKPTTLSLCETRPNPFDGKIVDLIYDDWFGLAPLASPESLSELSSISSRASVSLNLNLSNSIEKFLNKVVIDAKTPSPPVTNQDEIYESQLHTPIVIRRTPKFSENLATCADDWKTQNNYKRMGKVFVTNPKITGSDSDSNGDGSFGTAESLPKTGCCNSNDNILKDNRMQQDWKSADNIDNKFDPRNSNKTFTVSDSAMLNDCKSQCPVCPCTKLPQEECCQKFDHISCIMMSAEEQRNSGKYSITNTTSSSDTYYSLTGSEMKVMSNDNAVIIGPKIVQ